MGIELAGMGGHQAEYLGDDSVEPQAPGASDDATLTPCIEGWDFRLSKQDAGRQEFRLTEKGTYGARKDAYFH